MHIVVVDDGLIDDYLANSMSRRIFLTEIDSRRGDGYTGMTDWNDWLYSHYGAAPLRRLYVNKLHLLLLLLLLLLLQLLLIHLLLLGLGQGILGRYLIILEQCVQDLHTLLIPVGAEQVSNLEDLILYRLLFFIEEKSGLDGLYLCFK